MSLGMESLRQYWQEVSAADQKFFESIRGQKVPNYIGLAKHSIASFAFGAYAIYGLWLLRDEYVYDVPRFLQSFSSRYMNESAARVAFFSVSSIVSAAFSIGASFEARRYFRNLSPTGERNAQASREFFAFYLRNMFGVPV